MPDPPDQARPVLQVARGTGARRLPAEADLEMSPGAESPWFPVPAVNCSPLCRRIGIHGSGNISKIFTALTQDCIPFSRLRPGLFELQCVQIHGIEADIALTSLLTLAFVLELLPLSTK